jgi:hypothetical protein
VRVLMRSSTDLTTPMPSLRAPGGGFFSSALVGSGSAATTAARYRSVVSWRRRAIVSPNRASRLADQLRFHVGEHAVEIECD